MHRADLIDRAGEALGNQPLLGGFGLFVGHPGAPNDEGGTGKGDQCYKYSTAMGGHSAGASKQDGIYPTDANQNRQTDETRKNSNNCRDSFVWSSGLILPNLLCIELHPPKPAFWLVFIIVLFCHFSTIA